MFANRRINSISSTEIWIRYFVRDWYRIALRARNWRRPEPAATCVVRVDLITTFGCYKMASATKGCVRELHDRCRSEVRARVRRQVWKSAVLHDQQRPLAGRLPQHLVVRKLAKARHFLLAPTGEWTKVRARRYELAGLCAERLALHIAQMVVAWGIAARRMGERASRR